MASIRLDIEPIDTTATRWAKEAVHSLAARLPAFELDGTEVGTGAGRRVCWRRFRHRRAEHDLVTEQWSWLVRGVGYTLSGTTADADHRAYSEVFAAVAATFDPGGSVRRRDQPPTPSSTTIRAPRRGTLVMLRTFGSSSPTDITS